MNQTELHGTPVYIFGFVDANAPNIAGMAVRKAELKYAPEVKVEAQNGEGHVECIALSKSANKTITATFTGYITATWNPLTLGNGITFDSKFYLIDDISDPRNKGEFAEVTITATRKSLIDS